MKTILIHSLIALSLSAFSSADDDISLNQCPPAVQDMIQKNLRSGKLDDIERKHYGNRSIYVAEIDLPGRDDDNDLELHIAEDGGMLKLIEDINVKDTPSAVTDALRSFGGKVDDIDRVEVDGQVTYHAEIDRENDHDLDVVVAADGKIIRETRDDD
ncbi:hypothetical protein OVA24_21190 [Luteolibacter sp. SL250]|uniref:PepSY domain-containing protein n=1 Tax=Luteolibacter sp. SL250 TaxID=2995170 RepID=UPI0022712C4D|nr:hypothetical protein [Luteolibacter sp. SL250]WAC19737.1 hypothetical protein OVA24_21190 [Luteolibacter sp. SL250]